MFAVHSFTQRDCYLKQTSVSVGLKRRFNDSPGPHQFDRCLISDTGIRIGRSLKSHKIPYSTIVRKVEKWSRICIQKLGNQFFRLVGPIMTPSFNEIGWLFLQ